MAEARRVIPDIDFNGKSAKKSLDGLTEQIEYDDVASGASDTLSIQVFNKDMKFLKGWLPKKGDRITASLTFKNWTKEGADKKLSCGDFLLDEMKMTGGPLVATLGGISIPTNSAIKSTNRTKTWKKVSIKQIAQEIAKRYGLKLIFDGPNYTIKSIEQTDKSDSSFLYDLCKDYGLGMKVYKSKIVIWGKSKYEGKKATATIKRAERQRERRQIQSCCKGQSGERKSNRTHRNDIRKARNRGRNLRKSERPRQSGWKILRGRSEDQSIRQRNHTRDSAAQVSEAAQRRSATSTTGTSGTGKEDIQSRRHCKLPRRYTLLQFISRSARLQRKSRQGKDNART